MLSYSPSPSDTATIKAEASEEYLGLIHTSLSISDFHHAANGALQERNDITSFYPPDGPGTRFFQEYVGLLREHLVTNKGWSHQNQGGCAFIIAPDGGSAILCIAGSSDAGRESGLPVNKNSKAALIDEIIHSGGNLYFSDIKQTKIWMLLFHVGHDEVQMELSQPSTIHRRRITGWNMRILLPIFRANEYNPTPSQRKQLTTQHTEEIKVERKRKAS